MNRRDFLREFSSGGLVFKRKGDRLKVLLIKDAYGRWTWPKGLIDKGETAEEAAIREISEEVGLREIELLDKLDKVQYFYRLKGTLIFKTVYIYLFKIKEEEKIRVLRSEIQDAKWLNVKDALRTIEYKGAQEILKKGVDKFVKFEKGIIQKR